MNAPLTRASSLVSSASQNRLRAFGFANALRALGFLCLTAVALPQTAARAQGSGTGEVPLPTFVLHLRPENAAPSQAELRERTLSRRTAERAMTKEQRGEVRRKYAAGHTTAMVDKQAAETMKASDNALLTKIATKSKSDKNFLSSLITSGVIQATGPLSVSLSPRQAIDPTGRVSLYYSKPLEYDASGNAALFQNLTPDLPDSYLQVSMDVKAGKTYLVVADVFWGRTPFDAAYDTVDASNGILVSANLWVDSNKAFDYSNSLTGMMIPGGKSPTSLIVQCDKDGTYYLVFAGLSNEWSFSGIKIKEIAP